MTERMTVTLYNAQQGHQAVVHTWMDCLKPMLMAGHRMVIKVQKETRSLEQNSRLWAMLTDISRQVDWYGQKLSEDEWKDVFTAALKKEKVVPGIHGGFVVLGQRTSKMTKGEMTELQECMAAFAADKGVVFRGEHETV